MIAVEILNQWGAAWAAFMARALLGSSVLLAVVVAIWLPLRRRMSAQFAYGLFLLVLLKLVVPIPVTWPSWASAASIKRAATTLSEWAIATPAPADQSPSEVEVDSPIIVAVAPEPIVAPVESRGEAGAASAFSDRGESGETVVVERRAGLTLPGFLLLGWAVVTVCLLVRFARAYRNTRRLLGEAVTVEGWSGDYPLDLEGLRQVAGVRSRVRWAISPRMTSPAVGGLVRPTIVMPPDLHIDMTPKQLTWVLLHELAHVRRGDLWVVVAQRLVQAIFFFHPAVHLTNWIVDQLREYACDDAALAAGHASRRDCGEGFLTIVGRTVDRSTPASALGLFDSRMLIRRRLIRILDARRTVQGRLTLRAAMILTAMAMIAVPYARLPEAAANLSDRTRRELDRLAADEPRIYAFGRTFLHDDRVRSAGSPARPVLAVAYSPDGRLIASGGEDAAIVVRDAASGTVVARLEGHREVVTCLAFSPDGSTIASGGYDAKVRLWNGSTFAAIRTLSGHTHWVFALAFSPDGKTIASAGSDRVVRLWDAASGLGRGTLTGHTSAVRSVAFSPDGLTLASAGADREAIVWDVPNRSARLRLRGHRGTIRALAFAPDGRGIATAGEDGEVRLWDARTGRERATMTGHGDMVVSLAFSSGGSTLASGSLDSSLKLWDVRTGRERATLQGRGEAISSLAFSPDSRQLASGGFDGGVTLWEPAAPTLSAAAVLGSPDQTWSVSFSPDGKRLFGAGKSGSIAAYDPVAGLCLPTVARIGDVAALSPDGTTFVVGERDGRVRLIDVATGTETGTLGPHSGPVRAVAFSPGGKTIASGGGDGSVMIHEVASRRRLASPARPATPVAAVQFSPDGKALAVASGGLTLIDASTGEERASYRDGAASITAIAFSPDGRTLATSGLNVPLMLLDARTLALRTALKDQDCVAIAFNLDGRTLATSHPGGEIALWGLRFGRKLATLNGHAGPVLGLTFSPDGKTIASGGNDKTVRIWNLEARRLAPRLSLKSEIGCIGPVAISPDGKTLAVAEFYHDSPGDIALWDVAEHRVKSVLQGHEHGVLTLAFSPDGRTLVSSSSDRTVRLWDGIAGTAKGELSVGDAACRVAFSPDGTTIATAGLDKTLTLWEADGGAEIGRIEGFRGPLTAVAFSPDGRLVATGGGGRDESKNPIGEVKVFDVVDRSEVADLVGHAGTVVTLSFSPDGLTLVSGGFDSTVRIWDVAEGKARLSLGGFPDCVRALALSPDGLTLAVAARGDGAVMLFDAGGGGEIARLVGHGGTVLGLAFSPDGRSLTTGGVDRSIKIWEVPASVNKSSPSVVRR